MTTKNHSVADASLLPAAALLGVALIAADTCVATGEMSVSWWHEEVRTGRAPKPVIQQPRFTRWKLTDVMSFWAERAERGAADADAGERMTAKAKKASIMAREPAAVAKAQAARKWRSGARDGGGANAVLDVAA